MTQEFEKLTPKERKVVNERLLRGVVSRASTLSFVFAAAFSIYSLTSLDFLRGFSPGLSLWDNTWPRILFNALPLLLMGLYFRDYKTRTSLKAWLWIAAIPIVFMAACLIQVWPIIFQGRPEVYFFVHSANVFILTMALIVVAPPPRFIMAQTCGFLITVACPVAFLFLRLNNFKMLKFEMGDFFIVIPISAYVASVIHKLRFKIAVLDLAMQRAAAPFLGSTLTDAIYNQRTELLETRYSQAIVVQMDMRGFTKFYQANDPIIVKKFMKGFHSMVVRIVGHHGGYWHKSIGDAHIVTFGAMQVQVDLSDVPGTAEEILAAELRRTRHHFDSTLKAVRTILAEFGTLKEQCDIEDEIGLGIGVASGRIEIRVQGDDFRKELDIDGDAMIRAARLEEYTKVIRATAAPHASIIVVSQELCGFLENDGVFQIWDTTDAGRQVRNFPDLKFVHYCLAATTLNAHSKYMKGAA